MLDCEHRFKRTNRFRPDPSIPQFTNLYEAYKPSGYDRGHQMDAYDCGCDSAATAESFYYSNTAPQSPTLNRGIWKKLEEYTWKLAKEYDSVLGSIFMDGLLGGTYTRIWDASSFSSGIYFYRLRAKTQKLVLII